MNTKNKSEHKEGGALVVILELLECHKPSGAGHGIIPIAILMNDAMLLIEYALHMPASAAYSPGAILENCDNFHREAACTRGHASALFWVRLL